MRKLKLESLEVESFETTSSPAPGSRHRAGARGCPRHHHHPGTGASDCYICVPFSNGCESIQICRDTEYLDCTYGCTRNTCDARIDSCGQYCWIEDTARCAVDK
jgi:hypothetical protein